MRGIVGGLLAVVLVASACSGDDGGGSRTVAGAGAPIDTCDWPMWGYSPERTFATACETALSPATVGDLERVWFHATDDVVTATPAVVGDTVYVGDWAGVVYGLDRESGEERWRFQTDELRPGRRRRRRTVAARVGRGGQRRRAH
jgi:outer membrane protein assembly factor BamB